MTKQLTALIFFLFISCYVQSQGNIRFGSEDLLYPYYKIIDEKYIDFDDGSEPGCYYLVVSDTAKERVYWDSVFVQDSIENIEWNKTHIDSCDCLFMGLNREQWQLKDKPVWDSIDGKAIKDNGGWYMGDLPSSLCCLTMGKEDYYEVNIYHPSVDSTQTERHYILDKKNPL